MCPFEPPKYDDLTFSLSNHGTFFYNQLVALQILVGDRDGARGSLQEYFNGIYQNQIKGNGEQVST